MKTTLLLAGAIALLSITYAVRMADIHRLEGAQQTCRDLFGAAGELRHRGPHTQCRLRLASGDLVKPALMVAGECVRGC